MKISHLALPGIVLTALALRLYGIDFGLPHLYHADEPVIVNHAMAYGAGDLNPHFFRIPPLVSYLLSLLYGFFFLAGKAVSLFDSVRDFEVAFYRDPSAFYFLARTVFGALLGTLTVVVLYWTLTAFGRRVALTGAFFMAVCFLHVRDSHYIYVDIPLVFVLTVAFGVFFRLAQAREHPGESLRLHLTAGALIGLAAAVKYNGVFLVLPYLVATFVPERAGAEGAREGRGSAVQTLRCCALAALAAFLTYAVLNPYSLIDFRFFLAEMGSEAAAHPGTGWLHHFRYSLAGGIGWPLLGAACCGLIRSFFVRDVRRWAMAAFLLGYYVLIARFGQHPERYVLPLLPCVLFFAADFAAWATGRLTPGSWALVLASAVLSAPTLVSSVLVVRLAVRADTRTQALDWIKTNVPSSSAIALDTAMFMPRLEFVRDQLAVKRHEAAHGASFSSARLRKLEYQLSRPDAARRGYSLFFMSKNSAAEAPLYAKPAVPYDWAKLRENGAQFAVLAKTDPEAWQSPFFLALDAHAVRVTGWNPYRNQKIAFSMDPYAVTGLPFLLADLWARDDPGPPLEIYRLSRQSHGEET
ncbi:MAG: phospholipid carrier-dependent glycosyltransferase [Candidatus Omnitrophota bacterium]|jgi:hypothetical protein